MEKERLFSYIDYSGTMGPEASNFFSSIIEKHPYFHAARVLYLKSLKESDPSSFEKQLYKGAALLPDRRQLFFVLNPLAKSTSEKFSNEDVLSNSESDSSFVLIEGIQNTNGSLIDITDRPKEFEAPISGYELLEISDQEIANDSPINSEISEKSVELSDNKKTKIKSLTNNDLIEQFITSNPRLKPPQKMPEEQEDISLKSLAEPEDLITEPIAKI